MNDQRELVCPAHQPDGPRLPAAASGQTAAQRAVLAVLGQDQCPACPGERLTGCMVLRGGAEVPARRCGCCGAAWQHGIDWWAAADLGRLTGGS